MTTIHFNLYSGLKMAECVWLIQDNVKNSLYVKESIIDFLKDYEDQVGMYRGPDIIIDYNEILGSLLIFNHKDGLILLDYIGQTGRDIENNQHYLNENDSIATPEEIKEYLNSNIDYYSKDIATEDKKESLTIDDINKPIGELTQEQIDRIWNTTKGICGG